MQSEKKCGATTRSGNPCKNSPVSGRERCRMHGGSKNQKRGIEHHNFKHGLYSRYAGESLSDILDELSGQSGESLINPENEIRLMQALIISAKALQNDLSDLRDLDTISKIIDRLITAKQRSQAIMIEQKRLVPVSDMERFLDWMETMLIGKLGEDEGGVIIEQLKTFKLESHATNRPTSNGNRN